MSFSDFSRQQAAASALPKRWVWFAMLALAGAAFAAYHNTFSAPFIFDDIPSIADNPTIRDLRTAADLNFSPAWRGAGVAGRPMVNLSLALNHALGGDQVWGYHLFNLLVHIGAGLALFGVVRRTLLSERLIRKWGGAAPPLAFAIALLWLVHPLQTESVTCVIQRTESMLGLFYLLALYGFIRSTEPGGGRHWALAAVASCLLGAATKEVIVTLPVVALLYDRAFVSGTFREAWQRRARVYLALASSWVVVGALVLRAESRGGTVGFGHGVAWWEYALTQCRALGLYLKLSFWPNPLVLDYGTTVVRDPLAVLPQGLLIVALLVATVWALRRRPMLGFVGAFFFVILAPSSSVVPLITQTIAEHRMYLPLAAVIALVVLGLHRLAGRWTWLLATALGVVLGAVTVRRNADYRTARSIWEDTAAKMPDNVRAHLTLAMFAEVDGRTEDAVAQRAAVVKLKPDDVTSHFNLAFGLNQLGRQEEAVDHYRTAVRLQPTLAVAHINLGAVLLRLGRVDGAIAEFETVVRLKPDSGEDQFNLAQAYFSAGRLAESLSHYEVAAKLKPEFAEGHYRLGNARMKLERQEEAAAAYREAVRRAPEYFEAWVNLAGALMLLGRSADAVPIYEQALRLKPDDPTTRANYGRAQAEARVRPSIR